MHRGKAEGPRSADPPRGRPLTPRRPVGRAVYNVPLSAAGSSGPVRTRRNEVYGDRCRSRAGGADAVVRRGEGWMTEEVNAGRRQFLTVATVATGVVGAAFAITPFIASWRPSAR